ncbi:MAG: hypothetical protein ACTTKK_04375 [Ottowia sp.]
MRKNESGRLLAAVLQGNIPSNQNHAADAGPRSRTLDGTYFPNERERFSQAKTLSTIRRMGLHFEGAPLTAFAVAFIMADRAKAGLWEIKRRNAHGRALNEF